MCFYLEIVIHQHSNSQIILHQGDGRCCLLSFHSGVVPHRGHVLLAVDPASRLEMRIRELTVKTISYPLTALLLPADCTEAFVAGSLHGCRVNLLHGHPIEPQPVNQQRLCRANHMLVVTSVILRILDENGKRRRV